MDWVGAMLFIAGGILLLLALNWGSTDQWNSAKVITCFVIGGILMIVFILWQHFLQGRLNSGTATSSHRLRSEPMIPLAVFRSYDVCAVQYGSFVSGMVMLVMFYFVAIFMTIVNQLSASQAGIQLIYFAPGMVSALDPIQMSIQAEPTISAGCWIYHCHSIDQNLQAAPYPYILWVYHRLCRFRACPNGNGDGQTESN